MGFIKKQQQQVFETLKGLLHCLPLLSGVDSNSCHFLLFLRYKKGGIKIQTKHKYTYRTNTKQKLAFSCNIFRLFALLLQVMGMFMTVIICLMVMLMTFSKLLF